jgi:DNA-binding response OmpR family regulator
MEGATSMNRVLVIDADREVAHTLALGCLEAGIAVRIAETLAEGERWLAAVPIALVVVEASVLRAAAADDVTRLTAAARDIPLVASLDAATTVEERAGLELAGFRVETGPVDLVQTLTKTEVERSRGPRRHR